MFRYRVLFFDESDGIKEGMESGIVGAADYGAAAARIASYYGEELISMELEALEDVLCVDEILSVLEESSK